MDKGLHPRLQARDARPIRTGVDPVFSALAADQALLATHRDHALTRNWQDHREGHIKPDLLLIYPKPDVSASN